MTNTYNDSMAALGFPAGVEVDDDETDVTPEQVAGMRAEQPPGDVGETPAMTVKALEPWHPPQSEPSAHTLMSLAEVKGLAEYLTLSAVFQNVAPPDAVVKILYGREMGLSAVLSLKNIDVVKGKATLNAGTQAAMVKKSEHYSYKVVEHDDNHCIINFTEDGEVIGTSEFSIDDAKRAGLVKPGSAWMMYPRNMVFVRAMTNGVRWYCPDVFGGPVYDPSEIEGEFRVLDEGPVQATGQAGSASKPAEAVSGRQAQRQRSDEKKYEKMGPVDVERTAWDDDMKKVKVSELRNEMCPLHGVEFFKKGKMKSNAHDLAGDEWCNWQDIWKGLGTDMGALFERLGITAPDQRQQWSVIKFADLDGVKPQRYRVQDLVHIKAALVDEIQERAANGAVQASTNGVVTDEAVDETTGEITESLSI